MDEQTIFSPTRKYRYVLWRRWQPGSKSLAVIGLNPSTADEVIDDPTIRRCIGFAKSWGFDALCMLNLFAFRATDPAVMAVQSDPIGPENDKFIVAATQAASMTLAAWGTHGSFMGRGEQVLRLIPSVHCLGITKHGFPKHPLYIKGDTQPISYPK